MDNEIKKNVIFKLINENFFSNVMPANWYTIIDEWFNNYDFEPDLMYELFQNCHKKNTLSLPYMKKIAEDWYFSGVKNTTDLEKYNERFKKLNNKDTKKHNLELSQYEFKLIYHALLEIKEKEHLEYMEKNEEYLIPIIRRKLEKIIF